MSRFEVPEVAPGTLVVHGELDDVVPLQDAAALADPLVARLDADRREVVVRHHALRQRVPHPDDLRAGEQTGPQTAVIRDLALHH